MKNDLLQVRPSIRQTDINQVPTQTMTTCKRPRNSVESTQSKKPKRSKLLEEKINKAIRNTLKDSARKDSRAKYKTNVKQYFKFCADNNIPLNEVSLAKEDILCFFASSFRKKYQERQSEGRSGQLKHGISQKNLWYRGEKLARVLKGINNAIPASSIK